jgi:hypothetical protein
VRQRGQDLAVTADAAQQIPDRQARHSGGHRRLGARISAQLGARISAGTGARIDARQGSGHVRTVPATPDPH